MVLIRLMFKNIIWAFDPFTNNKSSLKKTVKNMRILLRPKARAVTPVHVLSPDQLNLAMDFVRAGNPPQSQIQKLVEKEIKKLKEPFLNKPNVVLQSLPSTLSAVNALLKQAKKEAADLIVCTTHAKKSVERFFLGSFAETLFLHSSIPVLVLNPTVHKVKKIRTILFPADFSKESIGRFSKVLAFAKAEKAKVIVFHKIIYSSDEKLSKNRDACLKTAKKAGVSVKYVVEQRSSSTADAINAVAKKLKCDLIAVTPRANALQAAILGSSARQVVRYSPAPVWIVL